MSTVVQNPLTRPPYAINIYALLALYSVVPLALVVLLLDVFIFERGLLRAMPEQPNKWWLWALVFNWPHIIASFVTFADRDYWPQYKYKFISVFAGFGLLVVGIYSVLPMVSDDLAFRARMTLLVFYMAYTVYHVLSQQFGLCRGFLNSKTPLLFQAWRYSSIVAGIAIYLLVFGSSWINSVALFGTNLDIIAVNVMRCVSILACFFGLLLLYFSHSTQHNNTKGRWYLAVNIMMMLVIWLAMEWHYSVFVIAIPRLIHDITAFIIYACHDSNRNYQQKKNYIYRALAFLPLSPWVLCPVIALGFANGLEAVIPWLVQMNFILALTHYYFEGFIWQQGQPHRQSLAFK